MKKPSGMTMLGLLATVGGIVIQLLSTYVSEKKTDALIEEKVHKALGNLKKGK